MKILIHGIIVSLLFFGGCSQKTDELIMENMQVFADSLNYDGDMFEISIPKSYSIKKGKGDGWGGAIYTFFDSLQKPFMVLEQGNHTLVVNFGEERGKEDELDSFFQEGVVNHSFFEEDTLKIEKLHIFDINLSSQCIKMKKNKKKDFTLICPPKMLWFSYDSTEVDETVCKKIISSLKYRKQDHK